MGQTGRFQKFIPPVYDDVESVSYIKIFITLFEVYKGWCFEFYCS